MLLIMPGTGAAGGPVGQAAAINAQHEAMLRISKATRKTHDLFDEGVYLGNLMSRTLPDLRQQVCADRLGLANEFLITADRLLNGRPPHYRSSISRYYYSMYHTLRAVAFFSHGGDDYQEHGALVKGVPDDFPDGQLWQNDLKDARLSRNNADYDPYPGDTRFWQSTARNLASKAPQLLQVARQYLVSKGCAHV